MTCMYARTLSSDIVEKYLVCMAYTGYMVNDYFIFFALSMCASTSCRMDQKEMFKCGLLNGCLYVPLQ
jgi:hypothetical protein